MIEDIYRNNRYCEVMIIGGSNLHGKITGIAYGYLSIKELEIMDRFVLVMINSYRLEINPKDCVLISVAVDGISYKHYSITNNCRDIFINSR